MVLFCFYCFLILLRLILGGLFCISGPADSVAEMLQLNYDLVYSDPDIRDAIFSDFWGDFILSWYFNLKKEKNMSVKYLHLSAPLLIQNHSCGNKREIVTIF